MKFFTVVFALALVGSVVNARQMKQAEGTSVVDPATNAALHSPVKPDGANPGSSDRLPIATEEVGVVSSSDSKEGGDLEPVEEITTKGVSGDGSSGPKDQDFADILSLLTGNNDDALANNAAPVSTSLMEKAVEDAAQMFEDFTKSGTKGNPLLDAMNLLGNTQPNGENLEMINTMTNMWKQFQKENPFMNAMKQLGNTQPNNSPIDAALMGFLNPTSEDIRKMTEMWEQFQKMSESMNKDLFGNLFNPLGNSATTANKPAHTSSAYDL